MWTFLLCWKTKRKHRQDVGNRARCPKAGICPTKVLVLCMIHTSTRTESYTKKKVQSSFLGCFGHEPARPIKSRSLARPTEEQQQRFKILRLYTRARMPFGVHLLFAVVSCSSYTLEHACSDGQHHERPNQTFHTKSKKDTTHNTV